MKRMLIAIAALSLAGCASNPIQIETAPVELEIAQPSLPRKPALRNLKWHVVTKDNVDEFIEEQVKLQGNPNPVAVALSMKDYETLSLNIAELKRYIQQQSDVIVYYQKITAKKPVSKKTP